MEPSESPIVTSSTAPSETPSSIPSTAPSQSPDETPAATAEVTASESTAPGENASSDPAPSDTGLTIIDEEEIPLADLDDDSTDIKNAKNNSEKFEKSDNKKKSASKKAEAEKTSVTTINEEEVPLSDTTPETGDPVNPVVPFAGLGASMALIAGILFSKKKKSAFEKCASKN